MTESKDIAALRARAKKAEDEVASLKNRNARLEKRLEIVDLTDVEDGDLKNIKQLFLDREVELDEKEKEITTRVERAEKLESDYKEREKSDLVKSLAEKYKIKAEDIQGEDDPEKKALQLYVERLTSGEEKKEKEPTPEEVFEHNQAGGKFKKMPIDMVTAEGRIDAEALKAFEKEHAVPSK